MSDIDLPAKRSGRGLGWLIIAALVVAGALLVLLYWNGYLAAPGEPAIDAELPPVIIEAQ